MFQLILYVIFKLTDWKVETERFGLCAVTQSFWFGFTSLSVPLCLTKTQYQYITDLLVTIYAPKSPSFQFKFLDQTDRFSVGALSKLQSSWGQLFETTFPGRNCTRTIYHPLINVINFAVARIS